MDNDGCPVWSPDGTKLAFVRLRAPDPDVTAGRVLLHQTSSFSLMVATVGHATRGPHSRLGPSADAAATLAPVEAFREDAQNGYPGGGDLGYGARPLLWTADGFNLLVGSEASGFIHVLKVRAQGRSTRSRHCRYGAADVLGRHHAHAPRTLAPTFQPRARTRSRALHPDRVCSLPATPRPPVPGQCERRRGARHQLHDRPDAAPVRSPELGTWRRFRLRGSLVRLGARCALNLAGGDPHGAPPDVRCNAVHRGANGAPRVPCIVGLSCSPTSSSIATRALGMCDLRPRDG